MNFLIEQEARGFAANQCRSRLIPCGGKIRLLSFNIQAGTSTARYHHYVTHSWRQVLPHSQRVENLDAIAGLVAPFDMVALQEADSRQLALGLHQPVPLPGHASRDALLVPPVEPQGRQPWPTPEMAS